MESSSHSLSQHLQDTTDFKKPTNQIRQTWWPWIRKEATVKCGSNSTFTDHMWQCTILQENGRCKDLSLQTQQMSGACHGTDGP
ncbi:hypothetical protein TNCV_1746711 [Trichonephila clavipes]|nr:hypothetical protein TNCV_1746711 [Trichonephila clavipes]